MPRKIKDVDDARATVALLDHPYRIAIIAELERRDRASPKDIAEELDVPLENLSYHFRVLRDAGLIELVSVELSGSAAQRVYKLGPKTHISPKAWGDLPHVARRALASKSLEDHWRLTTAAAAAGGIDKPESIIARVSVRMDAQAYERVSALLHALVAEIHEIEAEAIERIEAGQADEEPATVLLMLFDTPEPSAVMALDKPPERRPRYRRGAAAEPPENPF